MTCGMGASTAMIYTDALFRKKCAKIPMHFLGKSAQKSGLEKVRKNLVGAECLGKSYKKQKDIEIYFCFIKCYAPNGVFGSAPKSAGIPTSNTCSSEHFVSENER